MYIPRKWQHLSIGTTAILLILTWVSLPAWSQATVTIRNPKVDGYALDYCKNWTRDCGQPAADAFCKSQGYAGALRFEVQKDSPPTMTIGDRKVCDQPFCDRISLVVCAAKSLKGQPDLVVSISAPSTLTAGATIRPSIRLKAHNRGSGFAPGTIGSLDPSNGYMIDVVLSTDTRVPSGFATYAPSFREDVLLRGGRASRTDDLHPGASRVYSAGSMIPADTPLGSYYLCAYIDPANKVAESNETNNVDCVRVQVVSKTPQKGVYDVDISDIYLDNDCRIWIKHTNRGTLPLNHVLREQVWVDGRLVDDSRESIGVSPSGRLDPGRSLAHGVGADPGVRVSGRATVRARIDVDNTLAESNERNNELTKTLQCPRQTSQKIVLELDRVRVIQDGDAHSGDPPGEWNVYVSVPGHFTYTRIWGRQVNDGETHTLNYRFSPLTVAPGESLSIAVRVRESDARSGTTVANGSRVLRPDEWQTLLRTGRTFEIHFYGEPDYPASVPKAAMPVEGIAVFRLHAAD